MPTRTRPPDKVILVQLALPTATHRRFKSFCDKRGLKFGTFMARVLDRVATRLDDQPNTKAPLTPEV